MEHEEKEVYQQNFTYFQKNLKFHILHLLYHLRVFTKETYERHKVSTKYNFFLMEIYIKQEFVSQKVKIFKTL